MSKCYRNCPFVNGMNLRQAEKLARDVLGAIIFPGHGDGHHVAAHHLAYRPCKYNCRKKAATRDFIGWCRDIWLRMNDPERQSLPAA